MHFSTDYTLENFIIGSEWDRLPAPVQTRLKGCFIDLMGALVTGSRSKQFSVGLQLAERLFGPGDIPVIGSRRRFSFIGAAAAMGHSSNAFDIDDGHNLIRAHPGTAVIGPVLAEAYAKNVSRNTFLNALNCAYEACIRGGAAIMEAYQNPHSTGTFGPMGIAAGVGKLRGYTKERLNNVLSVADFNAPIVPGFRSVGYPSMNKDGVPFGVMVGCLALEEDLCGFEGSKNFLEEDVLKKYLDGLGERYEVMNLYFKPYPCCRWTHAPIDACLELLRQYDLRPEDVAHITVRTFERATGLSRIIPATVDEAQYNIAYPVAAAVVHGGFGLPELTPESFSDPAVLAMMQKLSFEVDDAFEEAFPGRRYAQAELETKDGRRLLSSVCEPRGEAEEQIGPDWLIEKFTRLTGPLLAQENRQRFLTLLMAEEDCPLRELADTINAGLSPAD